MDGLVVVDKPPGCTSHDVVARCRRIFSQKKVGHAGTLDPDATGVLLVGLGQVTRLMRFFSGLPKRYTGEVVLGVATTTLDAGGEPTGRWDMRGVSLEHARAAAASLTGEVLQVPPMVSALRVGGRRLHELARAGVEVTRAPRAVTVSRFDVALGEDPVLEHEGAGPVLVIDVECTSGTYVRSLAADLGAALGGGAYLRALRRLSVGPFLASDAIGLEQLADPTSWPGAVLSPARALQGMQSAKVGASLAAAVGHGRVLPIAVLRAGGASGPGPWAVLREGAGDLLAVYEAYGPEGAKPVVVLAGTGS
jgi:tRNA pseudouridine55 synthase